MKTLSERIEQFRKMATDDPDNELGHFRLGQLLMENNDYAEAITPLQRTLELAPQFSKVYQLLAECHIKLAQPETAIVVLTQGYQVADERGDKMPRDAMAGMLTELGAPVPQRAAATPEDDGPDTGFRCKRPGCAAGKRAKPLEKVPLDVEFSDRIVAEICSDCWVGWVKDYSIKVVNELRLDLSSEYGQTEYDKHMRGYFGFDDDEATTA